MRVVGPLEQIRCEKGDRYMMSLLVETDELATYLLPYGADATDITGVTSTVYTSTKRPAGTRAGGAAQAWVVTLVVNASWSEGMPRLPDKEYFQKSYSSKPYYIPGEYYGVRRAEFKDVYGNDASQPPDPTGNTERPKSIITGGASDADVGDLIFINYFAGTPEHFGSMDLSHCPWTQGSVTNSNLKEFIQQEFASVVCTIEFLVATSSLDDYATFKGIAGGYGSISNLKPVDATAGVWKALDQTVAYYKGSSTSYCKVKRQMLKCPLYDDYGCLWLADRNGGTWTW